MDDKARRERAYLMRRAADHLGRACDADEPAQQMLHERFAALYRARADAIGVQDHQVAHANLLGT